MTKHFLLCLTLLAALTGNLFAQDYKKTLGETVQAFFSAQEASEKINQSNRLNLIAKKFNTEWSAPYYAALSKITMSYEEKDAAKRDAYIDDAEEQLTNAASLSDKNNKRQQSEIYALTAMLANARLAVNPEKRWQKYGKIFEENLEKAKEQNADNPRIYYLKATSVLFTPKMFGGGKKKSLEYFEKADALFAKESKDDITVPSWGKEVNDMFMAEARKED